MIIVLFRYFFILNFVILLNHFILSYLFSVFLLLFFYLITWTVSLPTGQCTPGSIRLSDGASDMEGRVEVCSQSAWGTVSRFGWNSLTARVACGQLGYSDKSKTHSIFMDE